MTSIRCPRCDETGKVSRSIEDGDFAWRCPACAASFEVRTVFLRRSQPVDKDRFIAQVTKEMKDQGVNQAELGRLVGVSGAYISTILSGRRAVSEDLAERVARALRLETDP